MNAWYYELSAPTTTLLVATAKLGPRILICEMSGPPKHTKEGFTVDFVGVKELEVAD